MWTLRRIRFRRCPDHRSLGIICKTVGQAEKLYPALSDASVELAFLDYDSTAFTSGIVITSAHISKGLEFDSVIVPQVDDTNYANEMDRGMHLGSGGVRAWLWCRRCNDGLLSCFLEFAKEPKSRFDVDETETTKMDDHPTEARVG